MRSVWLMSWLSLGVLPVHAQTAPAPCQAPAYQQFDFWLGTWTVTSPNGQVAGVNEITKEEQGCLLVERWQGASGSTGQSYNYYNSATEKWRQVWVGSGALIDYEGGLQAPGVMRLEGTITYPASGQTAPFTGEWTLNSDGTVTQHFEQFDASKQVWTPWFTGTYTRQTDDAE